MSTVIFRLAVICLAIVLCVPVADAALVPLSNIVMVKGGVSYSLALKSDGTVLAWGTNNNGNSAGDEIFWGRTCGMYDPLALPNI